MKAAQVDPADRERAERARFEEAKQKIEALIEANPTLRQFKNQLLLDITSEGLRIQIVDERNRPMFDSGAATLKSYTREILRAVASSLNGIDNRISLSGHTDATPYAGGDKGVGNWELSADRANACRREMVLAGLAEAKIARVVGSGCDGSSRCQKSLCCDQPADQYRRDEPAHRRDAGPGWPDSG